MKNKILLFLFLFMTFSFYSQENRKYNYDPVNNILRINGAELNLRKGLDEIAEKLGKEYTVENNSDFIVYAFEKQRLSFYLKNNLITGIFFNFKKSDNTSVRLDGIIVNDYNFSGNLSYAEMSGYLSDKKLPLKLFEDCSTKYFAVELKKIRIRIFYEFANPSEVSSMIIDIL